MRAPAYVRLERFLKLIEQVTFESSKAVIVVEGEKDRNSLMKIGITGRILCLQSSGKNIIEFVENLTGIDKVIILTDFDREGVSLAKKLSRQLIGQGFHANLVLWKRLRELTRSEVRSIEELPKYYENLQMEILQKNGGKRNKSMKWLALQ